jgi:hypothetical protein
MKMEALLVNSDTVVRTKGGGRTQCPPRNRLVTFNFSLPLPVVEWLAEESDRTGLSRASVLRQIVAEGIAARQA